MEITTPRLTLRRARASDLDALHAVLSNEQGMLYWSTAPHERIEQTAEWLESMIASPPELSEDFIIVRDGVAIGKVGAWRLPEFGYILHPDHWGQGLGREAIAAFVTHALARPDVERLIADVDPRNTASLRVLMALGFRETGRAERTLETHIGWCDSVYLEIERGDVGLSPD